MRKYTNKLGIVCVEPAEGYLLKKNGQTFKKVYLGKNDRAELYEEVVDENYIAKEIEEDNTTEEVQESFYILTSPSGKKFKVTVADDGTLNTEEI